MTGEPTLRMLTRRALLRLLAGRRDVDRPVSRVEPLGRLEDGRVLFGEPGPPVPFKEFFKPGK